MKDKFKEVIVEEAILDVTNKGLYKLLGRIYRQAEKKAIYINPTRLDEQEDGIINGNQLGNWASCNITKLEEYIRVIDNGNEYTDFSLSLIEKLTKFKKLCYKWKQLVINQDFRLVDVTDEKMAWHDKSMLILDDIVDMLEEFVFNHRLDFINISKNEGASFLNFGEE